MLSSRFQLHISRQVLKILNLQIAEIVWKQTFNIVFHFSISSFFFFNSIKVFYFMFHVNAWKASVCILTVVAYTNLTSFYSGQHVHRLRQAGSQKHFDITLSIQNFLFLLYRVARFW